MVIEAWAALSAYQLGFVSRTIPYCGNVFLHYSDNGFAAGIVEHVQIFRSAMTDLFYYIPENIRDELDESFRPLETASHCIECMLESDWDDVREGLPCPDDSTCKLCAAVICKHLPSPLPRLLLLGRVMGEYYCGTFSDPSNESARRCQSVMDIAESLRDSIKSKRLDKLVTFGARLVEAHDHENQLAMELCWAFETAILDAEIAPSSPSIFNGKPEYAWDPVQGYFLYYGEIARKVSPQGYRIRELLDLLRTNSYEPLQLPAKKWASRIFDFVSTFNDDSKFIRLRCIGTGKKSQWVTVWIDVKDE